MSQDDRLREAMASEASRMAVSPFSLDRLLAARRRRRRRWVAASAVGGTVATALALSLLSQEPQKNARQVAVDRPPSSSTVSTLHQPPGHVAASITMDAAMKHSFERVADLARSDAVDSIVVGRILDVAYETTADGLPKTRFTVAVDRNIKGKTPDVVTVREDGGYLKAAEVINELRQKDPDFGQGLDPDSYVEVLFEGAAHPVAGQEVLLFLWRDPNPGNQGDYMQVGSVYGRFVGASDGSYQRSVEFPEMESSTTPSAILTALR